MEKVWEKLIYPVTVGKGAIDSLSYVYGHMLICKNMYLYGEDWVLTD